MKGNPFMSKENVKYKKNNITEITPLKYYEIFQDFNYLMVYFSGY
jgi:hypothetical protein